MTETENREVLEKKMARAITEAAKNIVSPPRSCPDCAAIGKSSRFGTDKSHGESLVIHIDREHDCMTLACYQNGELFWNGASGTTAETVTRVAAYLLDLEPPKQLKPRERIDDALKPSDPSVRMLELVAQREAQRKAAVDRAAQEAVNLSRGDTSEEIRWRMEQVVKAGLQYRDDLSDLAREFNRALEVVKKGDTQGPED